MTEVETHLGLSAISMIGAGLNTVCSWFFPLSFFEYIIGTYQSISTTLVFFLAMASHPEVQKKAQAEIDAVVGKNRLPTVSDKGKMPYVRALITEVLRWHPVVPLGELIKIVLSVDQWTIRISPFSVPRRDFRWLQARQKHYYHS